MEQMEIEPLEALTGETAFTPEDFWREPTIDELAAAQGITVPQSLNRMIGAATELWDSEVDFESFVTGINERRGESEEHREGVG